MSVQPVLLPALPDTECREVWALCREAFAEGFSDEDAQHALGGWHAVIRVDGAVVAHAALVPRTLVVGEQPFRTGYVEAVAVAPRHQGHGLGTAVMRALDPVLLREFALGWLSTGRRGFYARLGWEAWEGPSYVLRGGRRVRTAGEDAGLMARRFGASAAVPLSSPVVCEDRAGDCW